MIEPAVISGAPPPMPSMRFDVLLDRGMRACQALAGARWTDYNEHDPGVTILEQLAYCLTDAAYRLNYPVADLLAAPDGHGAPDPDSSLVTGDQVLSGQALTVLDYRKLLYDRVEHLQNVWLVPTPVARGGAAVPGLYKVLVERSDYAGNAADDGDAEGRALAAQVRTCFHSHRNLGEDIDAVMILAPVMLYVRGTLSISEKADPDRVLARVLIAIQDMLTPRPQFAAVDDLLRDGFTPDAVFDGPLLEHGALADDQFGPFLDRVTLRQIRASILAVDGVDMVHGLGMSRSPGRDGVVTDDWCSFKLDHGQLFHLVRPDESAATLALSWRGGDYPVDVWQVKQLVAQQQDDIGARERYAGHRHSASAYSRLASGRDRAVESYFSIQHQFPATYGLGRYGVPQQTWQTGSLHQPIKGGRRQRRAQVGQLRGYLLFFEQILANHFSQLSHVGQLFSTNPAQTCSYFFQPLARRQALPGDALDVLPLLRLPATAPPPAASADGSRQLVLVSARHARRHPALLRSQEVRSASAAANLAEAIVAAGVNADAYVLTRVPGEPARGRPDHFLLTLRSGDGEPLAFATRSFRSQWAAERARRRLAAWLCRLAGDVHLRRRHVGIRVLGDVSLTLDDDAGPLLGMSGLSAADAGALAERLLDDGQRPAHYHVPHGGHGRVGLRLGSGPGARFVEVARPAPTHRQALAVRDAVIAWLGRLACDAKLRARHLRTSLPTPPAPVLPQDGLANYEAGLEQLVRRFDPGVARRHQFVDHLLARLDERFDDDALERFDPRPAAGKTAFRTDLLAWKCSFLQQYAAPGQNLGGRRGAGFDYTGSSAASASGLEQRLRLLLGIGQQSPSAAGSVHQSACRVLRRLVGEGVRFTADQSAIYRLLVHGSLLENYAIMPGEGDGGLQILLSHRGRRLTAPVQVAVAGSAADAGRAIEALIGGVHQLQADPAQIYAGEDLYLIEHLLLRQRVPHARKRCGRDDFLHLRVSLVLPIYPMRFGRAEFRRFVEATAADNCPAHLLLDVLWLGPDEMDAFASLYRAWRGVLATWAAHQADGAAAPLDAAAQALRTRLVELAGSKEARK